MVSVSFLFEKLERLIPLAKAAQDVVSAPARPGSRIRCAERAGTAARRSRRREFRDAGAGADCGRGVPAPGPRQARPSTMS